MPATAQVSQRRSRWSTSTFAGFSLVLAGLIGLTLIGFDASDGVTVVVAAALGVAAGSVHPDTLDALRRVRDVPDQT